MKFKTYLNEVYVLSVNIKYSKFPIFSVYMNPDSGDYLKLRKEMAEKSGITSLAQFYVRFIIDLDKKNLYVFDFGAALHDEVIDEIKKQSQPLSNNYLCGIGPVRNNKIEIEGLYQDPRWTVSSNYNYTWAKRYFTNAQDLTHQALWDED